MNILGHPIDHGLRRAISRNWVLWLTWLALAVALAVFAVKCYRQNDRHIVYTLDDPYIHMAMAKNLATKGVFGVTPYEFSATTSSVLWTLLLAGVYRVGGISEAAPLILNVFFAFGCVWVLFRLSQKYWAPAGHALVMEFLFLFALPTIPLVFTGMEHAMHVFLMLLLAYYFPDFLSKTSLKLTAVFVLLALLSVAARYESLFFVSGIVLILFFEKRPPAALALLFAAFVPVVVMGIIFVQHGGYFLPNTLVLKGVFPDFTSWKSALDSLGGRSLKSLATQTPELLVVVVAALVTYLWRYRVCSHREPRQHLLFLVVLTVLVHLQIARTGWFYRYEAYLVALGIAAVGIAMAECWLAVKRLDALLRKERIIQTAAVAVLLLLGAIPLFTRGETSLRLVLPATRNIYEQQCQMGRFLSRYYTGRSIAANDIGAVNFFSDVRCLDFGGLGTVEILAAYRSGGITAPLVAQLSKKREVEMAALYASVFQKDLPPEWIEVGHWRISNNVACFKDTVTFFATAPEHVPYLAASLREFSSQLPASVSQSGMFTEETPP